MSYYRKSTEVVACAWNADLVCVPCVRKRLSATLRAELRARHTTSQGLDDLDLEELSALYAQVVLGHDGPLGDLDTAVFPQPVFANDYGDEDSCGDCLTRIEDTL